MLRARFHEGNKGSRICRRHRRRRWEKRKRGTIIQKSMVNASVIVILSRAAARERESAPLYRMVKEKEVREHRGTERGKKKMEIVDVP